MNARMHLVIDMPACYTGLEVSLESAAWLATGGLSGRGERHGDQIYVPESGSSNLSYTLTNDMLLGGSRSIIARTACLRPKLGNGAAVA